MGMLIAVFLWEEFHAALVSLPEFDEFGDVVFIEDSAWRCHGSR